MKLLRILCLYPLMHVVSAQAIEVAPGDYEQLPAGTTLGMIYYQHATTDSLYTNGRKASSDFRLTSDIGILRLLHVYELSDRLTVDPQFLLPFGRISSSGDASPLGDANGLGDLILASAFRYRLNDARDIVALTPYLYVPTGDYDNNNPLNIGENRWKFELQTAYVKHLGEKWAVDMVADAVWYGDNDDYSESSLNLEQDLSFGAQLMGRYMPTASTSFGVGIGHNWGGETRINGVQQDDEMDTSYMRLTATTFVTAQDQLQVQLGRDLSVEQGTSEDFRINLRYAHIF
ncbi:transporter [Vreelandella olivaria]|uniref:transporter n=1 Tax=Vreelandella olivaria TaxID=390919 RepID=UPI00201E9507|nr:transporter [Halomonas olivaria]